MTELYLQYKNKYNRMSSLAYHLRQVCSLTYGIYWHIRVASIIYYIHNERLIIFM